jgi:hypothetical protein
MISSITSFFQKPAPKAPVYTDPTNGGGLKRRDDPARQSFSKVFRWKLPAEQTDEPASVEIAGSFTRWEKVELKKDRILNAWHVTIPQIPGNRTHHYVLVVNGEPVYDTTCDGLAIPSSPQEERYQFKTERGPRVCMLFSNTK